MTPAARYAAAIGVLDGFLGGEPAEKLLSNWSRRNRYAGSKDRAAVRDIVFDCLRNLRSFQALAGFEGGRALAVGHILAQQGDVRAVFTGEGYAPAPLADTETKTPKPLTEGEQTDLPDWLVAPMRASLGADFAAVCDRLRQRAPVDLRVNLRKNDRATAQEVLAEEDILTEPVEMVPTALRVVKNPRRVAQSRAYLDGRVELMDAASQAVVAALPLDQAKRALDFCAGGGGKTLAMAALAPNLRISAHDQSAARLAPLKDRSKRAGAPVRLLKSAPKPADGLYDLVLLDVPCSGSGAWRRAPEGKWRLTAQTLETLTKTQAAILANAPDLVSPEGCIAYVTCSLLQAENEDQIARFCAENPAWKPAYQRRFSLLECGDGFFLSLLKRA